MSIRLTPAEKKVAKRLAVIKKKSTSHSPSPAMLESIGVKIKHDFCYLSNPHATELFLTYFKKDFSDDKRLRGLVEYYPSQNRALAEKLTESPLTRGALHSYAGGVLTTPALADSGTPFIKGDNIFVGNGATEVIQAVLQNFVKKKMLVPVPTFSPYLEFAPRKVKVLRHQLRKEDDFRLDTESFLAQVREERPDAVVIINPNNPDGGYHFAHDLQSVLKKLRGIETVIVDESFIHFAGKKIESVASLVKKHPNLVVIKSLSKDFGIAGLRIGYGVMSEKRVNALLAHGYLWNVSGFGEYFLSLLGRQDFLKEYEKARLRAIGERDAFYTELSKIQGLRVYPSKGNFFLIELLDGTTAHDLMVRLLVGYGIYIRPCGDKVGLKGEYVRIASRTAGENNRLIQTLKEALSF